MKKRRLRTPPVPSPRLAAVAAALRASLDAARAGQDPTKALRQQALILDRMFKLAALESSGCLPLALQAQTQCRMSIEDIARYAYYKKNVIDELKDSQL